MRIQADLDLDPDQTLSNKKFEFLHIKKLKVSKRSKTYLERCKSQLKGRKPGLFVILANFHAPGSASGSAFPIPMDPELDRRQTK
jgi:hypothetical protein